MPELPEVHTTVTDLGKLLPGNTVVDAWSDYDSVFHEGKRNIKDKVYFREFKNTIEGKKIMSVSRRGKNVLIHLSGDISILIHMKMTGHLLYGRYEMADQKNSKTLPQAWQKEPWHPKESSQNPLWDPFNRFIHMVISLSSGKHLVLCDMRKFGKVIYFKTSEQNEIPDLKTIGPEPTDKKFTYALFKERLMKRPNGKIKQVLMMPEIIAGIGNIYSDELLWQSGVHPLSRVEDIPEKTMKKLYSDLPKVLKEGMKNLGDSMSDYRRPNGERGKYQNHHKAYRNMGKKCGKGDGGTIQRIKVGGRSAHFCPKHQKMYSRIAKSGL